LGGSMSRGRRLPASAAQRQVKFESYLGHKRAALGQ
jgi:hypothetical protein